MLGRLESCMVNLSNSMKIERYDRDIELVESTPLREIVQNDKANHRMGSELDSRRPEALPKCHNPYQTTTWS